MSLDAALMLCRLLHYAAVMFVFGTSAFLALLVPADLTQRLERRLFLPLMAAMIVAAMTTILWLCLEGGEIGEGWQDAFSPQMLSSVLIATHFGDVWQGRLAIAACFALLPLLPPARRTPAMAILSALLLASLALVGHASLQVGAIGLLHRINHVAHLLAGAFWLGALIPLLSCLLALRDRTLHRAAGAALRRFSNAGHVAVAVVIVTGVVNTGLVLGSWPIEWSSTYQLLLACKIVLVAIMTVIALANRYVLVPRMKIDRDLTSRMLAGMTIAEIVLGIGVLALVGVFGTMEPA